MSGPHIKREVRIAARIADHYRSIGLKHSDVIAKIIKDGLAKDASEADQLLYDADEVTSAPYLGSGALNLNN